jgi:hypothetical protein
MKQLPFLLFFVTQQLFGQVNFFAEYAPTFTKAKVENSLHYNNDNTNLGQGHSYGLGWIKPMKKHPKNYWYWAFMSNKRIYELNRTQPYNNNLSDITYIRREARGVEALWGVLHKKELSPQFSLLYGGGITQNIVLVQYQYDISPIKRQTQTFGFGSVTYRNRFFVRTGLEIKVLQKLSMTIEPCISAEIKPFFVSTIDKVNPISYGLNVRAIYHKE